MFQKSSKGDFIEYVCSRQTGKYARRLWFLYEFLTGETLPLDGIKRGNYIDLLEPDNYYTITPARPVRRQRINDNLLGDRLFCPTVRRTNTLRELAFLAHYDMAKSTIQEIADMPDRKIDLFIRFCLQNNGRISARKRLDHFDSLSDEEIVGMEQAVQTAYASETSP